MEQAEPKEKRMKVAMLEKWLDILNDDKLDHAKRCELVSIRIAWSLGKSSQAAENYIQLNMGL